MSFYQTATDYIHSSHQHTKHVLGEPHRAQIQYQHIKRMKLYHVSFQKIKKDTKEHSQICEN